jgi:hypothetical protein
MPMHDYPFRERLSRGPYYTVVELAVDSGVPDVLDFIVSVDYETFAESSRQQVANVKKVRVEA